MENDSEAEFNIKEYCGVCHVWREGERTGGRDGVIYLPSLLLANIMKKLRDGKKMSN